MCTPAEPTCSEQEGVSHHLQKAELTSPSCCAGSDAAASKATVRTTLYDDIGTRGWETLEGVDGRALHNDFIDVSCSGAGLGH